MIDLDPADETSLRPESEVRALVIAEARALVIEEVRAELARKRMNASSLARTTGTNQQYWSRRLTGLTSFDIDDLARLSCVLRVPMSSFIPVFMPDSYGGSMKTVDLNAHPNVSEIDLIVGDRTHRLMWQQRIRNKDIAAALGIDPTSVDKKLRAEQKFSLEQLSIIAGVLGTTIAYLVGEVEVSTPGGGSVL